MQKENMFYVYWIMSGSRSYIGATVDPCRRLKQHNGQVPGGAARTSGRGPWHFEAVVEGFRTWKEALMYEWAAKRACRFCRGVEARRNAILALNEKERWTSNSPPSCDVPLKMDLSPSQFGHPPSKEEYACLSLFTLPPSKKRAGGKKWKKRLHGVSN